MARTPGCDKNGLKKGTWTPEEDRKLIAYVTRYGHWNWSQLPKFAGLSRCGKSCRLRWMNYLRPNIKKGNYTPQEEDIIIKLHAKLGNRWPMIAAHLPGRSDNDIKNHWHANLKKRLPQNSVPHASAQVSQPKDHFPLESEQERDSESDANTCPFQSTPTETAAAGNGINMPLEEDHFAFLDVYTHDPVSADWTQPDVTDISCFPSELFAPFVTETEILNPVYDAKLWNHSE